MDRSVDSIGTCSLDVEASADIEDLSEPSSAGTLRSASISSPAAEPHLPSYLSLACTVNGYYTTTNYDPIRLSRSRDTSPHRHADHDGLTPRIYPTYSVQNNLLSPPNLVPLPTHIKTPVMADNTVNTLIHHQEFYTSAKGMTTMLKETRITSAKLAPSKDTVDRCENGRYSGKFVTYEKSGGYSYSNGQGKCVEAKWKDENETKSFIRQRIERLYGPGALAQVVFPIKRQKSRTSESEDDRKNTTGTGGGGGRCEESVMKQSGSGPALPVLRHLRPEFRAQLPIISPRRSNESPVQKSGTLKDEVKVNGHSKIADSVTAVPAVPVPVVADIVAPAVTEETGEKDGRYFLRVLEEENRRLLKLADGAETHLSIEGLPEEIVGKLRSASGKARLLVSQKMQQFKGLCTNNITQVEGEKFPTTNEDLQGFWDMVMLQVDQVNELFEEIEQLKANGWKEINKLENKKTNGSVLKSKKVVGRVKATTTAAGEEARKQREEQRKKMLEERRRAMKSQTTPKETIEIFVPENSS